MKIMKRSDARYTYSDYLRLPEDKRYEILDGELHMVAAPGTKHQRVALNLKVVLYQYAKRTGVGTVYDAPCDVILSDENIVQPDILFVQRERSAIIGEANLQGAPDLVVEVLSPGTRVKDLGIKRKTYAGFGVKEYWIVDPEAETVDVLVWSESGYTRAGVFANADRLSSPLLPDLNLPVTEIFA